MAKNEFVQLCFGIYSIKLNKKYKKIKKYMKSNLFEIKMMDGTEKLVSELTKEADEIENN